MNSKTKNHRREILESSLDSFQPLRGIPPPVSGWIRTIRKALGMNGRQLAGRMQVSPARITALEQDELAGAVTLRTMSRAAAALDCDFVYGFLPRASLEATVRKQAEEVASRQVAEIASSRMQQQQLTVREMEELLAAKVEELVNTLPKSLWDL